MAHPPATPSRSSLLWPPQALSAEGGLTSQLNPEAARDLGLANLLPAFTLNPDHYPDIQKVLLMLCQDPDAIRYRQDVIADLLHYPQLAARLESLMPAVDALGRFSYRAGKDMNTLHEVTWRLGELQSIIDCVQGLGEVFEQVGGGLRSQGWRDLQSEVAGMRSDPSFQTLARELPGLLGKMRAIASVTIGVNLDQYLRPVEAALLAVNEKKFTSPTLLNRLFGVKGDHQEGLAPLHSVPRRQVSGAYALPIQSELGWAVEPLMVPLFADLAQVIEKITRPIARELQRFAGIKSRWFVSLRQDLIFYLGALRFIQRLQGHGLPVCRPDIAPLEERACQVEGIYNANLPLYMSEGDPGRDLAGPVVLNDLHIGPEGRILILTGPNQGGKTTYLQAAGLVQALAQVGLYVPGVRARISPVDNIYTHFPIEEKPEAGAGRFGDEAKRLGAVFAQVTRDSLVLLNESLSSTNAGESLYLAQDVVRILRRVGGRAVYSTHLHELAAQAEALNASTPGDSLVASLVASPVEKDSRDGQELRRSYCIERRPPLGRSYAQEIAARYGIGYEQLEEVLHRRGVLKDGPAE